MEDLYCAIFGSNHYFIHPSRPYARYFNPEQQAPRPRLPKYQPPPVPETDLARYPGVPASAYFCGNDAPAGPAVDQPAKKSGRA